MERELNLVEGYNLIPDDCEDFHDEMERYYQKRREDGREFVRKAPKISLTFIETEIEGHEDKILKPAFVGDDKERGRIAAGKELLLVCYPYTECRDMKNIPATIQYFSVVGAKLPKEYCFEVPWQEYTIFEFEDTKYAVDNSLLDESDDNGESISSFGIRGHNSPEEYWEFIDEVDKQYQKDVAQRNKVVVDGKWKE